MRLWLDAVGAWSPPFSVTVAIFDNAVPSEAWNVNVSPPLKPGFGVYVTFGGVPLSEPWIGCVTIEYVSGSPSASVATSVIARGAFFGTETD